MKNIFIVLILLCASVFKVEAQMESANFTSNKDSYVISGSTTNLGTYTELQAGINVDKFGVATFRRSYINFPISGIPTNAVITSAVLKVYQTAGATTTPSTQLYAERVVDSWSETTIASGTEPNVSTSEVVTSSTYSSSWRSFDVKIHVQKMVEGTYTNQGWRIRYYNEGQTTTNLYKYHSREAANDPVLEIAYYVPFNITAASITHCSTTSSTDGAINPTIEDGSGSNTYQWFNSTDSITGATSLNLSGRTYGWYGLRVTGSQGDKFYYSFLIGVNCANVSITYNPGANYVDDALLSSFQPATNLGTSVSFRDSKTTIGITNKSLLKFRLWVDPSISFSQAGLNLYANTHDNTNSNASYLRKVTSSWNESTVTWNTVPSVTSTNQFSLTASTTTNQDYLLNNIISFWNDWKGNNPDNYGMLLELQTSTNSQRAMSFHSSDASSSKPSMTFTLSLNPNLTGTVTAGSNHICNGTSTVVTVSGYMSGSTFQWQKSTNGTSYSNISGATSSTYTTLTSTSVDTYYRCIVSKGLCSSLTTNNTFVQIKTVPTVIVNNTHLCTTPSVTLTATPSAGGGTYLWSNSATTASIIVSPTTSSNYTVVYTLNGCSSPVGTGNVAVCTSTATFVDSTELGQISVSINEAPTKVAPYHYMVSQKPIPSFSSVYHLIKDSIYGGVLDSATFFAGFTTEPNFNFLELNMGRHYVSVFDSKGDRVFDREVLVLPTVTLSQNTSMTISGNRISSTGSGANTSVNLFISDGVNGEMGFVLNDISKTQFMGLTSTSSTSPGVISSYKYGFSVKSNTLYLIENGAEGVQSYSIQNGSIFNLRIIDTLIEYYVDGVLKNTSVLADSFNYKGGYAASLSGVFINILPWTITQRKFYVRSKIQNHFDCENQEGGFNFITNNNLGISNVQYSWKVYKNGILVSSSVGLTNGIVTDFNPSPYGPGVYKIRTVTNYLGVDYVSIQNVYIGVEASWTDLNNYISGTPNDYSIERNSTNPNTYSFARGENILISNEIGWIQFNPILSNSTSSFTNILRLSSLNTNSNTPNINEIGQLFVYRNSSSNFLLWTGPTPGFAYIPNNSTIRLAVTDPMTTNSVKIYLNNSLISSFDRPSNSILLRAHSKKTNEGFDNVITSFNCDPLQPLSTINYTELKRTIDGGYALALEGKIKFTFDEEYDITTSKYLPIKIYDEGHNLLVQSDINGVITDSNGSSTEIIAQPYNFDDNRYELILSSINGITENSFYYLEVETSTKEKRFLKILYKN